MLFGYWYADRYTDWPLWNLSLPEVVLAIAVIGFFILFGGWLWDKQHRRSG